MKEYEPTDLSTIIVVPSFKGLAFALSNIWAKSIFPCHLCHLDWLLDIYTPEFPHLLNGIITHAHAELL